jgi:hypothetical protein
LNWQRHIDCIREAIFTPSPNIFPSSKISRQYANQSVKEPWVLLQLLLNLHGTSYRLLRWEMYKDCHRHNHLIFHRHVVKRDVSGRHITFGNGDG